MSESLSTLEYESLEQKYIEIRSKLKRSLQNNEKNTIQIQKLKKRIKLLEDENNNLQNQMQNIPSAAHDSESDASSSDRPNQNESNMANLVHSKNLQISDLLKDIEDVEQENMVLREKLTETKESLATATSEISSMTECLKAKDVALQEQIVFTQKMSSELENLKEELELNKNEKSEIEKNLEIFSQQVNKKVDDWKELLDQKNSEIAKFKSENSQNILKTSFTSSENQEPVNDNYLSALKVALFETETKLGMLKSEMEKFTQDLKESTDIINKLKGEKIGNEKKIKEMTENEKEIKTQLSKSHDRCQNLQKEVEFANKLTKVFENDLTKLKGQLKHGGQIDLVATLEENQSLKIQNLLYEKQIVGLIKDINQIQEMCNVFEVENASLRHQLGLEAEENINIDPKFLVEEKKQKKLIEKLKADIQNGNEENINLKMEVKALNRKIGQLTTELMELKNNPDIAKDPILKISETVKEERPNEIKSLSEENEALRKGLHEILNSVQEKNHISPREIKSDVLERLLKALDVKHISGWYHPAMRIQAELHTLEGINGELREQLFEARTEIDKLKMNLREEDLPDIQETASLNTIQNTETKNTKDSIGVIRMLSNSNLKSIQDLKINILNIIKSLSESEVNMEKILEQEFQMVQKHMELIHKSCNAKKEEPIDKIKSDKKNDEMDKTEDISKHENEIDNKTFVICEVNKWKEEVGKLKQHIVNLEQNQSIQIEEYLKKIVFLQLKLILMEKKNNTTISTQQLKQVQDSLNEHVVKYRKLLTDLEEQNRNGLLEFETLKEIEKDLTKENDKLKAKLKQLLCNSYQESYKHDTDGLYISQKLAETEIQALSEKQRADHTNNLYKLVKEQLRKSEENFTEFSKYGENLLQKNLFLQERVVELEDRASFYIDQESYKALEDKLNTLVKENEELVSESISIRKKYQETDNHQFSKWNHEKEQELLGLKHQIVDLTSTSDEKLLIGQLHSDLAKSRLEERENEIKVDFLRNEISHWERRYKELNIKIDDERKHFEKTNQLAQKKICVLQNLLIKQRIQYHGFLPLIGQEIFAEKIKTLNKEKHEIFVTLHNLKKMEMSQETEKKITESEQDKELDLGQSARQNEFKNQQVQYLVQRIEAQEKQMEKLELELFAVYKDIDLSTSNNKKITLRKPTLVRKIVSQESLDPKRKEPQLQILRNMESQTEPVSNKQKEDEITLLKIQLHNCETQISAKAQNICEINQLLNQKDKELIKIKGQLDEKVKQVTFLERKLKEFKENRERKQERHDNGAAGDGISVKNNYLDEQVISLRANLKSVQEKLSYKEKDIVKYQALLKEDRDKHSLAAANLQQELCVLKKALALEQQKNNSLEEATAISRQKSVVVENYVSKVRALEKHLAELHTQQTKLESQLHASQQEATRWRQMAQERLIAMQELAKSLNEQHNKELTNYKTDFEKLRELSEEDLPRHKIVNGEGGSTSRLAGYIDPDVIKLCREKDEKIQELQRKLQKIETTEKLDIDLTGADNEKGNLTKEIDVLRRRYETMLTKEKNCRDEIRDLKDQLSKRTNLSARTNQSEKSIKEQLQRKINQLEKEIDDLNDKLSQQMLLNEKHKLSANEDFEKWKKQKYWQENCEKYKNKWQEREDELQKLQQACTGFRMLIERLEREKINLENRIKSLKSNPRSAVADQEIEHLKLDNTRLTCELATLEEKMEIRQQGAGALGAAIMQEKLEAQERKIAVLELSAKGTVEVRNELERLQTSLSNTQKHNLCLEAENLELKMDLEKYNKETPHLQEQIQHLENYIELLKNENQTSERQVENNEDKKVSQLERTVFILKRVVEKLQVENKRLHSGKRPLSERSSSAEKLKRDYLRLKEQNTENLQRIKDFETKLAAANKKNQLLGRTHPENEKVEQLRSQLEQVKEQLAHKTVLLDKVKTLLHGAAAREKLLLIEITELRQSNTEKDFDTGCSIEIPSPIAEVSEENSV